MLHYSKKTILESLKTAINKCTPRNTNTAIDIAIMDKDAIEKLTGRNQNTLPKGTFKRIERERYKGEYKIIDTEVEIYNLRKKNQDPQKKGELLINQIELAGILSHATMLIEKQMEESIAIAIAKAKAKANLGDNIRNVPFQCLFGVDVRNERIFDFCRKYDKGFMIAIKNYPVVFYQDYLDNDDTGLPGRKEIHNELAIPAFTLQEDGGIVTEFFIPEKTVSIHISNSAWRADKPLLLNDNKINYFFLTKRKLHPSLSLESEKAHTDTKITDTSKIDIISPLAPILDKIILYQTEYLQNLNHSAKPDEMEEELGEDPRTQENGAWANALKNATIQTKKAFEFNFDTRIYKYDLRDENDTTIYYVKNPLKNYGQYRGFKKGIECPSKPFPSHDPSIMKKSIATWTKDTIIRKKMKDYSKECRARTLEKPGGKRPSRNLGLIMSEAVGETPSLSAYDATSATLKNAAGKPFFEAYFAHCNPKPNIKLEESATQTLRTKQEWCHLIGYGDGGEFLPSNLVAGSYQSNTAELAVESAMRSCKDEYSKKRIAVKVTAYLIPYEDSPSNAYKNDSSQQDNLISHIQKNINQNQELVKENESEASFIKKNTLYRCLVAPTEKDIESAKEGFFLEVATKAIAYPRAQNILQNLESEEIELYLLKKSNKSDQEKKKLHNILRAAFDAISCQLYETKHATAFVRYVITLDEKIAADFVIDGQREELDSNEFYLIRHFIYTRLMTISSKNKKTPDDRIILRDNQHNEKGEEGEWDEGDEGNGKDGELGKRLARKIKPSKNIKI